MHLLKYSFFHTHIFTGDFILLNKNDNILSAQHPRKKPKNGTAKEAQPKNPVAMLNELRPQLTYELASQSGPVHAPIFTISVTVSTLIICFFFSRKINYKICSFKN